MPFVRIMTYKLYKELQDLRSACGDVSHSLHNFVPLDSMLLAFNYFRHKTARPDFLQATSQVVHTCSRVLSLALTDNSVRGDRKGSMTSACSASLWLHIRQVCSLSGQTWSQNTRTLEYLTGHLTTPSKRLNFIYVYLVVERSGGLFNITQQDLANANSETFPHGCSVQ
jgi:hypothetical protein